MTTGKYMGGVGRWLYCWTRKK